MKHFCTHMLTVESDVLRRMMLVLFWLLLQTGVYNFGSKSKLDCPCQYHIHYKLWQTVQCSPSQTVCVYTFLICENLQIWVKRKWQSQLLFTSSLNMTPCVPAMRILCQMHILLRWLGSLLHWLLGAQRFEVHAASQWQKGITDILIICQFYSFVMSENMCCV